MKRCFDWILVAVAAGCLTVAVEGCKKQEKSEWTTVGKKVSMTELRNTFQSLSDQQVQTWLSDVAVSLHYGQYATTLAALEKLAAHPKATPKQKMAANKVMEQVKQLAAAKVSTTPAN